VLFRSLDTKRKELLLSKIAYDAFCGDRLFFSKRELVKQIETLLAEMLPDEPYIDGNTVLKSIEVQHGILVERAQGVYSFSHLTLQEFLTAQHMVDTRQSIEQLIADHLTDNRWQEIFLLLVGLQQADTILLQMEHRAQWFINTPNLQNLLLWADRATVNSESSYKPVIKRTIAIFLALDLARALALDHARVRALDLDIDRAHTLILALEHTVILNRSLDLAIARVLDLERMLDLVLDIAHRFEEMKIFSEVKFNVLIAWLEAFRAKAHHHQQNPPMRQAFIEQIHQTWLNALNLQQDWIRLSRKEVTALDQYLSSNLLIVQCKHAAVWISPQTWEAIENRMLLQH